ncbi:MAG: PEP/pyruvate-binding domain-containing protein [Desulfovibrio sp.]
MYQNSLFKHVPFESLPPGAVTKTRYRAFATIINTRNKCLKAIEQLDAVCNDHLAMDRVCITRLCNTLSKDIRTLIDSLMIINSGKFVGLAEYYRKVDFYVQMVLDLPPLIQTPPFIIHAAEITGHVKTGRNIHTLVQLQKELNLHTLPFFVIADPFFNYILEINELQDTIDDILCSTDMQKSKEVAKSSKRIRELILSADIPAALEEEITTAAHKVLHTDPITGIETKSGLPDTPLSIHASQSLSGTHAKEAEQSAQPLQNILPTSVARMCLHLLADKYTPEAMHYRTANIISDRQEPFACVVRPMMKGTHSTKPLSGTAVTSIQLESQRGCKVSIPLSSETSNPQTSSTKEDTSGVQQLVFSLKTTPQFISTRSENAPLQLTPDQATPLVKTCMQIEKLCGPPQKVHWSIDQNGNLFIHSVEPVDIEESPQSIRERKNLLNNLRKYTARFNATEEELNNMQPSECSSMHEFVKFCYENSIAEFFHLLASYGGAQSAPRRLQQAGGQNISILDIGQGLFSSAQNKETLSIDDIQSIPMWAFIWGMDKAEKEFIPTYAPELKDSLSARQNYSFLSGMRSSHAILSGDYLYFSIYFGQHLFVLDADCSQDKNNRVHLFFKDGSENYTDRLRHIAIFSKMLKSTGFTVEDRKDSLTATLTETDNRTLRIKLTGIGRFCTIIQLMNMGNLSHSDLKKLARFPDERRTELEESIYG